MLLGINEKIEGGETRHPPNKFFTSILIFSDLDDYLSKMFRFSIDAKQFAGTVNLQNITSGSSNHNSEGGNSFVSASHSDVKENNVDYFAELFKPFLL